jgi:tetratricopeptide (TPR) repeat protein
MTPEIWDRLKPLFNAAVEKSPADRQAFLATVDADEEVRQELQDLVRAFEAGEVTQGPITAELQTLALSALAGLKPGELLGGQFQIMRWLGRGGMGDVYEAIDLHTSESVALKVIRPEIAQSPAVLERFRKEVQLAHRLTGPNVCRIHALFVTGGQDLAGARVFLTMELLEGVTLAEEINKKGPLPWPGARRIARDICAGVAAMHQAGIIHRDIKTRNVMLARRGDGVRAVVMDFGLARELSPPGSDAKTGATVPGMLVGTPASMAPEQFSCGPLTPATDIYALGVVLYEMVTGRAPFGSGDAVRAAISRARTPSPASTLQAGIPRGLDRVIAKCLQFDPQQRYQTASEVARELERCSSPLSRWSSETGLRRLPWLAAGVILMLLSFFAWEMLRQPTAHDPHAISWYEQGVAALREGSYLQAAGELQQAVAVEDGYAVAHARLAEAWAELDYTGAAEHEMLAALEQAQRSRLSALDRKYIDAIHATLMHEYGEAVQREQAILDVLPSNEKAYGYLDVARAQEKNNDIPGAVKSYEQAAKLRPDNPAPFVHLGILKSREQDAPAAEAAFQQAENLYRMKENLEGIGEVEYQRAHSANERGDTNLALKSVDTCMRIAKQLSDVQLEVRALSQLANAEYMSDQDDKAITDASSEIELARENHLDYWVADGMMRQGNAYLDKGDLADAEKVTLQGLASARRDQYGRQEANAELTLASIRDQQGKLDEQIQYAQSAHRYFETWGIWPQAFETGLLLQRGQMAKGELEHALVSGNQQLELARKINSHGRIGLAEDAVGEALMEMQRYPDALAHFQESLHQSRMAGQNVEYELVKCAEVLGRLGRYDEAEARLSAISANAAARPNVTEAIENVQARMLLSKRKYKEALQIARHAWTAYKNLSPTHQMEIGYVITVAEVELGRLEDAQRDVQQIAEIARRDSEPELIAESSYLFALVDLRSKAPERAIREAESARRYFAEKQEVEWLWMSEACIAAAAKLERNPADAAQRAKKALDTLNGLQQTWGSAAFQQYSSRPDVQVASKELRSSSS